VDLALQGVAKSFGAAQAVAPTDLGFRHGELTALLGPSGCGKTTLLRMIAGLEAPSRGRILLGGEDITDRPAHARRFGMVFQSFALFPHLRVRDNVAYALSIAGVERARRDERAEELLDLVRLPGFGDRRVGDLSGGQRQRVAIARALAQDPEVFLLDEPMSALDAKLREEMQVELRQLQRRLAITTIVVTHDQREAMSMADAVVVMSDGRVEQSGPPAEVYHSPANAFVAGFVGRASFLDGVAEGGGVRVGGMRLEVDPPAPFLDGAPVTVACRPERACLGGDRGPNAMPAEVTFVRDVGATRDIHLDSPVGPVVVEYAVGENAPAFRPGERVQLRLPPAALRVFPRDARPRAAA
jgi:putative spermidine/putrescine transport system ATP-binding protein